MVRIKRLTLKHFKSFRTGTVTFAPGFTVIVGPNGSGKSNIIDAILFVLGEGRLKQIRASRLTDLIMRGARDGSALVSIELEADGKTYTISRSIDQQGRSVYRLNGKRTTRSAIKALLTSIGVPEDMYNVVLQGEVTRFLKMTPKERRSVLDSIAGIAEYEMRKEEALKKLEDVEARIRDVNIILGERKAVLERLREEKERAEKYIKLKNYLRGLRKGMLLNELRRVESELSSVERQKQQLAEERQKITATLQKLAADIAELESEKQKLKKEIEAFLEKTGEGELIRLEALLEERLSEKREKSKRLEELQRRLSVTEKELNETGAELMRVEMDLRSMKKRVEDTKAILEKKKEQLKELECELENLPEMQELKRLEDEIKTLKEEFFAKEKEHARILGEYNALVGKYERAKERMKEYEERVNKLKELKQKKHELEERRRELFEVEKALNNQYVELEEKLRELRERVAASRGMLNALRSLGISRDVLDFLLSLQEKGELYGIRGFLIDLISFDDKYARAVEAAGGRRLFYIVVDTAEAAADAIKALKRYNVGRATFIPLDRIRASRVDVPSGKGILGRLSDFISTDEQFRRAVDYAFGDTVLTENIDIAKQLAGSYRAVTLDGDLVERSGIMSGGKKQEFSIVQAYKAQELKGELENLEKQRKEILHELSRVRENIHSVSDEISRILSEISRLEALQPPEIPNIEEKRELLSKIEAELQRLTTQLSALEKRRMEILQKVGKRKESLLQKRAQLLEEIEALENDLREMEKAVARLEERTSSLEKRKAELEASIKELKEGIESERIRISELEKEIEKIQQDVVKLRQKLAERKGELERLKKRENELEQKLLEMEREKVQAENRLSSIGTTLQMLDARALELNTRVAELRKDLEEYADVESIEVKDPRAEIERVLEELRLLEPVNMAAINEYEEQQKRIAEIEEKLEKLKREKQDVLNLLEEIERKKEEVFMRTFTKLSKLFAEVYKELVGGDARLKLIGKSFDEYGLTVEVVPPRKKPVPLEALSGGEKAMVALAFIFAVAMHKPTGFYILDEPDLMLDKKNAEKMAKFIKSMSKTKQFIVISHRDPVVKEADQVIGVYMGKDGTSVIEILPPASASS